jgi:ubiquinone/menaquinone biosynthesis C-methylase UbiE
MNTDPTKEWFDDDSFWIVLVAVPAGSPSRLRKKGFRVTGVDRTAFLLEKARMRAAVAQVEISWVLQDMREFVRPDAFDPIISMSTSFGYFEDRSGGHTNSH